MINRVLSSVVGNFVNAASVSQTLAPGIQAGDLIIVAGFTREDPTGPTGFTESIAPASESFVGQRAVLYYKIADGSEGGTTVTLTQAASARIGILWAVYRSDAGSAISLVDAVTLAAGVTTPGVAPTIDSRANPHLVLASCANVFNTSDPSNPLRHSNSDAAWLEVWDGTTSPAQGTDGSRASLMQANVASGPSPNLEIFRATGTNNDFQFTLAAFEEEAGDPPVSTPISFTGSVPTQNLTENSSMSALDVSSYFSGSETPFSYSVVGTLPTGLSLSGSVLSGTPTQVGTFPIVVRGTDTGTDTADTNNFNLVVSAEAVTPTEGVRVTLHNGAVPRANESGLIYLLTDGNAFFGTALAFDVAAATDANGVLQIDLSATAAAIGDEVFLTVFKRDMTTVTDSIGWQGYLTVQDIN